VDGLRNRARLVPQFCARSHCGCSAIWSAAGLDAVIDSRGTWSASKIARRSRGLNKPASHAHQLARPGGGQAKIAPSSTGQCWSENLIRVAGRRQSNRTRRNNRRVGLQFALARKTRQRALQWKPPIASPPAIASWTMWGIPALQDGPGELPPYCRDRRRWDEITDRTASITRIFPRNAVTALHALDQNLKLPRGHKSPNAAGTASHLQSFSSAVAQLKYHAAAGGKSSTTCLR
jgi:hypothetical protein